ncbi:uncharacterized protein LOC131155793 [Malania oleifera]|uniref:uncharacterized protein LOC131155793 n=1 Tax=Malania oleifera TaxID=397392 RepID=UPI0025ADAC33|nr:uncharacterized protein LOC131155793 [Malania oleifera]
MVTAASVDSSLWWDSFVLLITDLENASLSSDLPPHLVKKLNDNRVWFVDLVSLFKPPNQKSRDALNLQQVNVGSHQLKIRSQLKDAALQISSRLCLDEVQSYILVDRFVDQNNVDADFSVQEFLHAILIQYYIDRQCLLKCTRQILMHALYHGICSKENSAIKEEVLSLVSDGLEGNLLSVLQNLLSSSHPEHMDVDLFTLWAEEILIEENLVLDILFLAYYESFCSCNSEQWKKLCSIYKGIIFGSFNFGKLAVSTEAVQSIYHAKVRFLLILIETLDLDNLLQMIHDETPFRQGSFVFSVTDVQEMDAIISGFDVFQTKEAGPLILTWAVFLCLISSLPEKQETNLLMEIDHIGYVRQAFEAASLNNFLEILQSDVLKDFDVPVAGYRSVMRTFVSAFIASYEINLQVEDNTLKLILDILCRVYQGEESLCVQFWDKDSFIDGPIRCLLCNLEGEFPFRIVEFIRFLSALSEGAWPAECVYNFLDKSVGISSLFEISSNTLEDNISQIVETHLPLHVPGVEGLIIPSETRGHVLKVIDQNVALVRWEYAQSGVLVLLLRLAQELCIDSNEEVLVTLDLLCRLVSFNTAVCVNLINVGNSLLVSATHTDGQMETKLWVDVVGIVCTLIRKLSPSLHGSAVMSMGVSILAKMLKCSPSHVTAVALKKNIFEVNLATNTFDVGCNVSRSASWLLSGRLAKFLLIDCEQNDNYCPLTTSVLEFTMELVETGVENDFVIALVIFSLQYVLVNHEYWKYKAKDVRWKVTLKVLEAMKKCILSIPYSQKLGMVIRDILLCDSSIHSTFFRIICTTTETLERLYVSRLYELMDIEGLQLAICSALDIIFSMLSRLSVDLSSSLPVFHQALLSSTAKPIPVVTAMISLISYFRYPAIQIGAASVLSMLFMFADYSQQYLNGNACFGLDDKQIKELKHSVGVILHEQSLWNEDLFLTIVKLLTSAARYQPAFLAAIICGEVNMDVQSSNDSAVRPPTNDASFKPLESKKSSLLDSLVLYVERSNDLIKSNPRILLIVLEFLKTLWQGAANYKDILELLKKYDKFWEHLSNSVSLTAGLEAPVLGKLNERESLNLAYKYQCQSVVLEIMTNEAFLQKKLQRAELLVKQIDDSSKGKMENVASAEKPSNANTGDLRCILSTWREQSVLGDLIKSYASCEYNNEKYLRSKVAAALFTMHVIRKLTHGDTGSLSVSLIEKIRAISKKLGNLPAFSELVAQYSRSGYSKGEALNALILSDLYYHIEGELEGRKIDAGPFKELSQYLHESKLFQIYQQKCDGDLFALSKDMCLFELERLQADLGLDMWCHSEWKASRAVADKLLLSMEEVNSMTMVSNSKLSAMKALINMISVFKEDLFEKNAAIDGKISEQLFPSCINHVCHCFRVTTESLAPVLDASEDILDFLAAQAELLLHLIRFENENLSLPTCVAVLKTTGFGLKVLSDFRPSISGVKTTVKLLLTLLLSSLELSGLKSQIVGAMEKEYIKAFSEVSNSSLGLLPILCKYIETTEHCILSLTNIDLIVRGFSTPNTWFPIMQKHLQLKHVVLRLQDESSDACIPIILKFLLTLSCVKGGAEMLLAAGFFSSLRMLFSDLSDGVPFSVVQNERSLLSTSEKIEKPQHIWGLSLAVVTAVIQSLGESSCTFIEDSVIPYFFSEKAYLILYYLNAPDFPSDNHNRKRARAQKTHISLTSLKETEHTVMLICALAKHQDLWVKTMKGTDSQLRERSIHILAFISRGIQRLGDSPCRTPPLFCAPVLKEEFDCCTKPSFVNSRNGWFAFSPLGCVSKPKLSPVSTKTAALLLKDQAAESCNLASRTYFSDTVAIQIYRITFLLLKFLCLQAEGAARRAEEVGFVDLAHFPELPMPEILHSLQDQAVAIVTELCDPNKSTQNPPEIQSLCFLLLQIMEMSLYLELCVSHICGMRPVLGRVEEFTKSLKLLLKAAEAHVYLKAPVKSLKQMVSLAYPGLSRAGGFLFDTLV